MSTAPPDYRAICLANGDGFTIVDDQDYDFSLRNNWYFTQGYANRGGKIGGKPVSIALAREIAARAGENITGMVVGHRNGDKLDNRRSNLRAVSRGQNRANRPSKANGWIWPAGGPPRLGWLQIVKVFHDFPPSPPEPPEFGPIPLTKGMHSIVDEVDFLHISQFKWSFLSSGYAVRRSNNDGAVKYVLMHNVIADRIGLPRRVGMVMDHINGNKLDNRRSNLRLATRSQNNMNRGKSSRNKSGHKGVCWNSAAKKWKAQISAYGKNKDLGCFEDINDAVAAYAAASLQLHGEFARC